MKSPLSDRLVNLFFYGFLAVFSMYCLVPFVMVISSSFMSESALLKDGYSLLPRDFSLLAYKLLLQDSTIFKAYGVTIFVTVVGTLLAMIFTSLLAYVISSKSIKYRNHMAFYVYFTMLFQGGLVAEYILISKYLGMKDTIWVLIIPALISPWNMFLLRNFFASIDDSLKESAKIDGASDLYILFRIILPISMPAMATIGLFYALAFWNKWFEAMLYISNKDLYPLQYLIINVIRNIEFVNQISANYSFVGELPPKLSTQLATTVVTIGPIVLVYPFVQKYFVKGLMVGAVKG